MDIILETYIPLVLLLKGENKEVGGLNLKRRYVLLLANQKKIS